MKVLDPGHRYELPALDGETSQTLQFVKRLGPKYPGNKGIAHPGTNIQDVIRVLIDRARYVNAQEPSPETEGALENLRIALFLLEARTHRKRGGHLPQATLALVEAAAPCAICGHISCALHDEGDDLGQWP